LEGFADWRTDRGGRTSIGRNTLQAFHPGNRQSNRVTLCEFSGPGLLDLFRDRARFRTDGERAGVELDSGAHVALHRAGSVPRRRMYGRIFIACALFGGLALRQLSPRSGRRYDPRTWRAERPRFGT